jgi:hypothetical protein
MRFNPQVHYENRAKIASVELAKYHGKHVAWNLEGTRILACGEDDSQVLQALHRAGIATDEVVFAYVPKPEEILLGGGFVVEESS